MMIEYLIKQVQALGGHRLRLLYAHGGVVEKDFAPVIAIGSAFTALSDPDFFTQAKIGAGGRTLEWPGELDFCADALWFEAHPEDYAKFLDSIGAVAAPR
jgi:hypothetical protein